VKAFYERLINLPVWPEERDTVDLDHYIVIIKFLRQGGWAISWVIEDPMTA
jgi:hypothetical protein